MDSNWYQIKCLS